jgi:hypothetical protein
LKQLDGDIQRESNIRARQSPQARSKPMICDHTFFSCDHKCRFFADLPALRQKNRSALAVTLLISPQITARNGTVDR